MGKCLSGMYRFQRATKDWWSLPLVSEVWLPGTGTSFSGQLPLKPDMPLYPLNAFITLQPLNAFIWLIRFINPFKKASPHRAEQESWDCLDQSTYIRVILGLYWGYIGVILGQY